jgi:hypothetical protein
MLLKLESSTDLVNQAWHAALPSCSVVITPRPIPPRINQSNFGTGWTVSATSSALAIMLTAVSAAQLFQSCCAGVRHIPPARSADTRVPIPDQLHLHPAFPAPTLRPAPPTTELSPRATQKIPTRHAKEKISFTGRARQLYSPNVTQAPPPRRPSLPARAWRPAPPVPDRARMPARPAGDLISQPSCPAPPPPAGRAPW